MKRQTLGNTFLISALLPASQLGLANTNDQRDLSAEHASVSNTVKSTVKSSVNNEWNGSSSEIDSQSNSRLDDQMGHSENWGMLSGSVFTSGANGYDGLEGQLSFALVPAMTLDLGFSFFTPPVEVDSELYSGINLGSRIHPLAAFESFPLQPYFGGGVSLASTDLCDEDEEFEYSDCSENYDAHVYGIYGVHIMVSSSFGLNAYKRIPDESVAEPSYGVGIAIRL